MGAMCACFSAGEACLASVIVLTGASLDGDATIAALSNSSLYLSFVVASLFAPAVLEWLGSDRRALAIGLVGVSSYGAAKVSSLGLLHLLGATAAGASGALLWTAEGSFLSKLAAIDAACEPRRALSASTSQLAGILATSLPCALTAAKLLASAVLIPLGHARATLRWLFATYAALGLLAAACLGLLVTNPEERASARAGLAPAAPCKERSSLARTGLRIRETLARNCTAEMALLIPNNVAFGLATGNMPMYGSRIVVAAMGAGHIGWLFALSGLLSAAAAAANASLSSRCGRAVSTTTGALAFAATGLLSAWLSTQLPLDQPSAHLEPRGLREARASVPLIVLMFLLYGYGMAVWQGTTMAVFAERFSDDPPVGFANLKLHSGLASAFAFYAFHRLGAVVAGYSCAAWALLGSVSFLLLGPAGARSLAALRSGESGGTELGAVSSAATSGGDGAPLPSHAALELGGAPAVDSGPACLEAARSGEPGGTSHATDAGCSAPAAAHSEETAAEASTDAAVAGAGDDDASAADVTAHVGWVAHAIKRRKHMEQILQ